MFGLVVENEYCPLELLRKISIKFPLLSILFLCFIGKEAPISIKLLNVLKRLSLKSFSRLGIVLLSTYSVLNSINISFTSLTDMVFSGFT